MTIYYELKPKSGKSKTGEEKTSYYPVVKRRKVIDLRDLAMLLSNCNYNISLADEAKFEQLFKLILDQLNEGNTISIPNFGSFSLSIKSRTDIVDPESIRSEQIEYNCINFRTNPHVKAFFSSAKFEKYNVKYSYVD